MSETPNPFVIEEEVEIDPDIVVPPDIEEMLVADDDELDGD